jgi:hypothetical protein
MDPITIKFIQFILAEVLGGILCLGGIYLFIRGISGKSSPLLQGGLASRPGSPMARREASSRSSASHLSLCRRTRRSSAPGVRAARRPCCNRGSTTATGHLE